MTEIRVQVLRLVCDNFTITNDRRPVSVSVARFATASSIPAKLEYVVRQGYIYLQIFFSFLRFDLF
jgi:hypothetical protein